MSYVDILQEQIQEALKEANESLDWLEKNGPDLIHKGCRVIVRSGRDENALYDWLADQMALGPSGQLLLTIIDCRKAIKQASDATANAGSPDTLRDAASTIDSKVVAAARELSFTVTLGRLPSTLDSNWKDGDASENYEHAVNDRDDAVRQVATYATPISTALKDIADEIENFYADLFIACVGFATAMAGAIAAIVTLPTGAGSIAGVLAAILGLLTAAMPILRLMLSTEQTFNTIHDNLSGEITAWPKTLT